MIPEAPEITKKTKILSIDVESNSLHGEAFAVGAVLVDCAGTLLDEFSARCPIKGETDEWVVKHVLPSLTDFPETHKTARGMRGAFWDWYKQAKEKSDYVLADNSYPVEDRFLIQCQEDDIDERYWEHPFPLMDLSSMLLQIGVKPSVERNLYVGEDQIDRADILKHNPRWDAWASALAMIKALKQSGRLKA